MPEIEITETEKQFIELEKQIEKFLSGETDFIILEN